MARDGLAVLPGSMSREARLLLQLAANRLGDPATAHLATGGQDWDRFTGLAEREVMLPAAWRRLTRVTGFKEDAPAVERLRTLAMVHEFRLRSRFDLLARGLAALEAAGIPVLVLKGGGLAISRYADPLDRAMSDHDLLVAPEQAEAARRVLGQEGWFWPVEPGTEERYRRHHHLPPLHRTGGDSTTIELHVGLFAPDCPIQLRPEDVRASALVVRFHGMDVRVPDAEYQLLHAALHYGYSHMFLRGGARFLSDLEVLVGSGVDWDRFLGLARRSRAARCCHWALWIGREVGGVPVPEGVLAALGEGRLGPFPRLAMRYVAGTLVEEEYGSPSTGLQRWLWELTAGPGVSGHGAIRPWDLDPERPGDHDAASQGRLGTLRRALGQPAPWLRFAKAMLGR